VEDIKQKKLHELKTQPTVTVLTETEVLPTEEAHFHDIDGPPLYGQQILSLNYIQNNEIWNSTIFFTVKGYSVVADFMAQSESKENISEALSMLLSWNSNWNPPFFKDRCQNWCN